MVERVTEKSSSSSPHQLQVIELSLWQILARNFKPGIQLHQATTKIAGWDANTFGGLFGNMKNQPHWPEGLGGKLDQAIDIRNWLAHHFPARRSGSRSSSLGMPRSAVWRSNSSCRSSSQSEVSDSRFTA